MALASLYGPVITGYDVEQAAKTTVGLWVNAYVDEVARQQGTTLEHVRHYGVAYPDGGDPGSVYPAVALYAPGTKTVTYRSGQVDAVWLLGVGVVVTDTVDYKALRLAQLYGAALRALLVQQGSLGGFATCTTWVDEETASVGYELDRWIADCTLLFEVTVPATMTRTGGPLVPPADPTVPLNVGTVTSDGITVAAKTH